MIIANFTPDKIEWMHVGANGTIPAYNPDNPKKPHIVNFDDSRANHILNKFAVRGLVQMNFGDDEEAKKKESLKLWRIFWERQIENQNQHNEQQKEAGNRYSRPTDELDEHAKLLGIELLRPWTVAAKSTKEVDELKGENMALKKSIEAMQAQMSQLMQMMAGGKVKAPLAQNEPEVEPGPDPSQSSENAKEALRKQILKEQAEAKNKVEEFEKTLAVNRNKYMRLGESNMNLWVSKNWDDIMAMPKENRDEIEEKYFKLYGVDFPTEKI